MIPFKDKLIVVGLLKDITKERDQLRAENDRLREGLKKIYDLVNDSNTQYAVEIVITIQDEVQQTLNEVTK